jgi:ABC-type metal ion transport system substrate-binding protein
VITEFDGSISELGPFGAKEGLDRHAVIYKLKAALKTLEGRTFRMVFAKQAKQMKDGKTFGEFPSKDKLLEMFKKDMNMYQTLLYLEEKERSATELTKLMGIPEKQVMLYVDTLKKKNMWSGELLT